MLLLPSKEVVSQVHNMAAWHKYFEAVTGKASCTKPHHPLHHHPPGREVSHVMLF